jgi:hypothetical protein
MLIVSCVDWTNPSVLQAKQTDDLCLNYYVYSRRNVGLPTSSYPERLAAIKAELDRRGAVRAEEWPFIDTSTPKIGMSECGVLAAWGEPPTINHTVTAGADVAQYVYGSRSSPRVCGNANGRESRTLYYDGR